MQWTLGKTNDGYVQGSMDWIDHVKTYFDSNTDVYKILDKIEDADGYGIEVVRTAALVDGNGACYMLNFE